MVLESSSVLNSIYLIHEQTNKAHRKIDGEPYFMLVFLTLTRYKSLTLWDF